MSAPWILSRLVDARRNREKERGAVAVITAVLVVLLFAMAAVGVDIASQVSSKQRLHDTMDMAAHEAAFSLSTSGSAALAAAVATAKAADPDSSPEGKLYCVVASTGSPLVPDWTQMPATCSPGAATPYNATNYKKKTASVDGWTCNEAICAVPCHATQGKCNTISVWDSKLVDYNFAPVIGFDQGNTGVVVSTACAGSCGTSMPNPMDVVILADRTQSMSDPNRRAMVDGIEGALKTMNPLMHYVSLATIHKSKKTDINCLTDPYDFTFTGPAQGRNESDSAYAARVNTQVQVDVVKGEWVAVPFSNNYLTSATTPTLNSASQLVKSIACMRNEYSSPNFRTHLASALKGAARYLLGYDLNNLASLPTTRPGTVRKAIIFETDGKPQEVLNKDSNGLSLTVPGDMGVGGENNEQIKQACKNFTDIAAQTKNAGPIIITVGFGDANTARCGNSTTHPYVRDALAAAASPHPGTGAASRADSDCSTTAEKTTENGDGDFYFCASNGSELGPIFQTALGSLSGGIKLIRLPA
ncbi:TadE/TadG family type IV pilus assembly protein [Nocardioides houyundeii]|uniref:TadE/TadG family type IV pilus assembly protein n=1 Tax=Nocardioides houyundeii TaxID=2045452 RepID=UPI0013153AC5|nr:TadE/TadG family type IV pilus assembly protein [Nocardioides houyundeii]